MGYLMGVPNCKASKDYSIAGFIRKTPPPFWKLSSSAVEAMILCLQGCQAKMSEVLYTPLYNPSFRFMFHCSFPFDSPLYRGY